MAGPQGPQGQQGAQGALGLAGPQGIQGPPGQVLVLDGGVVTGPAGASVVVSPIAVGAVECPTGGVRITQVSDGGTSTLCNGAVGARGPTGFSPGVTPIPVMSAACVAGGFALSLVDGGSVSICNGAQGVAGPAGPAGPMGAVGSAGPAGPMGRPGLERLPIVCRLPLRQQQPRVDLQRGVHLCGVAKRADRSPAGAEPDHAVQ